MPSGLQFITSNPTTAAYRAGIAERQRRDAAEQAMTREEMEQAILAENAPVNLRRNVAAGRIAGADATVAEGTVDPRIASARHAAWSAGAVADVDVGTVDPRIASARHAARSAGAVADVDVGTIDPRIASARHAARSAGAVADVDVGTVDPRIASARHAARSAGAVADVAEVNAAKVKAWKEEKFFEIAATDPEMAEAWAAQNNVPVPAHMSQIIRNRKAMGAIIALMKALKDQYPGDHNADLRSQEFKRIMSAIVTQGGGVDQGAIPGELASPEAPDARRTQQFAPKPITLGGPVNSTIGFANPNDMSVTDTGSAGAVTSAGSRPSVFEQKRMAWLALHTGDDAGALAYASGASSLNGQEIRLAASRLAAAEARGRFPAWTPEQIDERAAQIAQNLQGGAQPAASGAAIPVPSQLMNEPDGTVVQDANGNSYVKRGNQLIPQ